MATEECTMTNLEQAKCLLAHGYNASEIAEALQMHRESALALIRRIDRARLAVAFRAMAGQPQTPK